MNVTLCMSYGSWILQLRIFKCSFDQTKRSFYRSLNTVCGRVGRSAADEAVVQ